MKVFFSTLSAILVAAVIIWFVFSAYQTHQARLKWDGEMRQMNVDSESRKAFWEWSKQRDKNPQSPPSAEKLTARLREIREASENNRPIPPSPWQTPETPTTNNAQSQQPAPEIQAPPGLGYVILTRDVEVSRATKKIVIPKDSKLPVIGRGSRSVGVRFQDEVETIPKSATSESE